MLPIKNLIIQLNTDNPAGSHIDEFALLLPQLDVVADVYILSHNLSNDAFRVKRAINDVVEFLLDYPFYRINVHPVHPVATTASLEKMYNGFSQTTYPFNQEAYSHQSIARLMILPILTVDHLTDMPYLERFLTFLRERTMIPSLYCATGSSLGSIQQVMDAERERIVLELHEGEPADHLFRTLCRHFDFDDLLTWAAGPDEVDLPASRSIVFDEVHSAIARCVDKLSDRKNWSPVGSAGTATTLEQCSTDDSALLQYHLKTQHLLKETLTINGRTKEWTDVAVRLGMECIKRSTYGEALNQFDAVINSSQKIDDEATLHLYKALCHLKLEQITEAEAALAQAEMLNPTLALIYYYRGHSEFAQKDYIEAIDQMQKALDMDAKDVPQGDAYFYMGMAHINIQEYDDGLRMMQRAEPFYTPHQISPVLHYMGVCHFGNNNLAAAYDFFQKALAAQPSPEDLSSIYLYLGMCHKEQEQYREALNMLEKACNAEENRLDIHNLMGFCYFKLKEHEKAIQSFVRAVEIDPSSGIDWANLGVNVRATGKDDNAIILFKKAISLDPSIGFAWKHLQELTKKEKG